MRKIIIIAFVMSLIISAFFVFGYNGAQAAPPELKYSTHDPLQASTMVNAYIPWINKMNSDARGEFEIKIYAGGVLGRDPKAQIKLLKDGVVDIAVINSMFYPKRFPDDDLFGMPFTIKSSVEGSQAVWNMLCKGLLRGYEDLKVLSLSTNDAFRIHTKFPVKVPEDLKGHRFRVSGALQAKFLEVLGTTPVALPITQVAENISRGVIDGVLCDTSALFVFRINEVVQHYLDIPLGCGIQAIIMDRAKYESLTPQGKLAIDMNIGRPIVLSISHVMKNDSDMNLEKAKQDPNSTVYVPNPKEMADWQAAAEKVKENYFKENPNGEKLYNALQKELAWIRSGGINGAP